MTALPCLVRGKVLYSNFSLSKHPAIRRKIVLGCQDGMAEWDDASPKLYFLICVTMLLGVIVF